MQVRPACGIIRAWAPYAIIIVVFVLAQIDPIKGWLDQPTRTVNWPGLHITGASGKASTLPPDTNQVKEWWGSVDGSSPRGHEQFTRIYALVRHI